jgi:N-acyl-D-amino-acid deacylase
MKANLEDKDIVKKLVKELKQNKSFYKKLILVDIDKKYRIFKGKTFENIANNMGVSIEEAIVKILTLTQKKVIVLNQNLSISNIDKGIKNMYGIIASNGMSTNINDFSEYFCDQRSIGTFPKYLSQYMKVLPFETLVYKITGLVKEKLNLKDKGYIKIGMDADILILNPQTISDQSTIQNPLISSKGIEIVIVNGKVALNQGQIVNNESGEIVVRN